MELDKRFKVLPFCCFGTEKRVVTNHIGEKGYFANEISSFCDINICKYGTLATVLGDQQESFYMSETEESFSFFIPECFVKPKEKQYRALTIDEFMSEFNIGNIVAFRHKMHRNSEYRTIYNGYRISSDGEFLIYFGIWKYTLAELFGYYELLNSATAKWQPFGVEVEE